MKLAAWTTLRYTFDALYPVVDQLRARGHDVEILSPWKGAAWADRIVSADAALALDRLWLVASASDAAVLDPRPVVMLERGCGQTYDADERSFESSSYSTGRVPNAQLFLCPNRFVSARRQRLHPDALAIVTGSPHLDQFEHLQGWHAGTSRDVVAFAFGTVRKQDAKRTPELYGAWEHYRPEMKHLALSLRRAGYMPVATAHARSAKRVRYHIERSGFEWWENDDVLLGAGVVLSDNTSLMYEFAALGRPVIVLNAPWYRRDVHHGLRFWECLPGEVVDDALGIPAAVHRALRASDPYQDLRSCADRLFERRDGRAAARCAQAIEMLAAMT